jgi:predicted metalloendopeptidase
MNRVVANYFGWRLTLHFSDYTSQLYTRLYFEFQRTTEGLRVQEQLWEFCYSLVETYYPSVVGRMYIDNYFNQETIQEVEMLIDLIRDQVKQQLTTQTWMDQKTRQQAKQKVSFVSLS